MVGEAETLKAPRVLVVDDSTVIRQSIKKILTSDYDVTVAEDGEAAWGQLLARPFDVVITDIEMPRLDGYAFICRIRAADDPKLRDVPIITITGADDEETKVRAYACGATDFIIKPLKAVQLQACVQAYIRFGLNERGAREFEKAATAGAPLSLIRGAIDQYPRLFKDHGEQVGEAGIAWAAERLRDVTGTLFVSHLGASEFAVLLNGDREAAMALCAQMRQAVARAPFVAGKISMPLTLSLGVASAIED